MGAAVRCADNRAVSESPKAGAGILARIGAACALSALCALLATPGKAAGGHVGFLGCSNTVGAVSGYGLDGGTRFWPNTPTFTSYGGGTVEVWADPGTNDFGGWGTFQGALASFPDTSRVWVQICVKAGQAPAEVEPAASTVLAKVHELAPGRTVYVSALNGYSDHVCSLTGTSGATVAASVRDWAVSHALAVRGPTMPALSKLQVMSDGCHPNPQGQKILGAALISFFGS